METPFSYIYSLTFYSEYITVCSHECNSSPPPPPSPSSSCLGRDIVFLDLEWAHRTFICIDNAWACLGGHSVLGIGHGHNGHVSLLSTPPPLPL